MGTNIVALLATILLLVLAFLSFRIDKIPARLFTLVKQERAREDSRAQATLLEAAALKVGPLVSGIRTYHEQIAASLRAQLAEAETRARIAERRALDASTYLDAASTLIVDLRALRDELSSLVHQAPAASSIVAPALPAEPAMVAARLIPRGAPEGARPESRRTRTLSGVVDARREATPPPPPATLDMGDSNDFLFSERPSDPEGERTRVGPRPTAASLGLPALKPTLLSMPATAQPAGRAAPPVEIEGQSRRDGGAA
ncbi:MAG: hypothetical protein ABI193_01170 [Minicystis sp.]